MHIDSELVESKITILRGKGSENNHLILKTLALEGPLIKYDLFKALKSTFVRKKVLYSTISRRVDDLVDRGYLKKVGTRSITVGKRQDESSTYGITGKGFIASLTIESVVEKIPRVLRKNPHLEWPFPRKPVLKMIEEMFTDQELKFIGSSLLTGYLKAIPKDLESLKSEQYIAYLFPAFTEAPDVQDKFQEKDWSKLLQIPEIYNFINDLLSNAEKGLKESLSVIREIRKRFNEGNISAYGSKYNQ